ncbi:MAG: T9SS type A sorting domain-containing protein, partial [Salibacteraceae bacterium]
DLETQREVPLSIFSTTSGVTSFQLDNTENLDSNVVISIIDNVTGKVQILENGPMAVYLNANQLYDNRFTIQFKNKNAPDPTGVNDIQESRLNLTYNEKTLFINNVIGMERIDLVSTTGSIVESQSLNSSFESTVNLNNLSKGIYIARILNIDGSVDTKKFVIQ